LIASILYPATNESIDAFILLTVSVDDVSDVMSAVSVDVGVGVGDGLGELEPPPPEKDVGAGDDVLESTAAAASGASASGTSTSGRLHLQVLVYLLRLLHLLAPSHNFLLIF
jgi:hypothetical protein